ncbi:SprT family zinc-dependent metalloprotease [Maridesulfovibrio sp.]|uniref:M48 family metallopeptidase n=1 Tax=Maridesulfovibrio sp. TaxID=2795000 RepID=UPI002A18C922|nr:SprT family zinc-dependent metalloprotease [Maridesulfovibrio sp.]
MPDFPPPYCVRISPRAKNVIIKLIPDKGIEVVLPRGVNPKEVPGFLEKRREWIETNIRRLENKGLFLEKPQLVLPDRITLTAAEKIFEVSRVRNNKQGLTLRVNVNRLQLSGSEWTDEEELYLLKKFVRDRARLFLGPELRNLSAELNLPFGRMTIRSQRKRWGSCSARGNINLNMKLMFLPYRLVRYVLIHELCHTVHLNHSPKYWRLVRMIEPDVDALEKELGEAGPLVPSWMNHEQ